MAARRSFDIGFEMQHVGRAYNGNRLACLDLHAFTQVISVERFRSHFAVIYYGSRMLYEKRVGLLVVGFSPQKGVKSYDGPILAGNYHIAPFCEEVHADMPAWHAGCVSTLSSTIGHKHQTVYPFNRPITGFIGIRDVSPLLTRGFDRPVTPNWWWCCKRYGISRTN